MRARSEKRARGLAIARREARLANAVRSGKIALAVAVGLVVVAGFGYLAVKNPGPKKIHWHANWLVVVDDEPVDFASPAFDGHVSGSTHLHMPNFRTIHYEGTEGTATLGSFFRANIAGDIADDRLRLAAQTSAPGTFVEDEDRELRVRYSEGTEPWQERASDVARMGLFDEGRILVLFGNYSDERVAFWEAQVPARAGA